MTDTNKLTEARIEIARLEAEVEFQKRMKAACVDVIRDQVKKSTPAMAESSADRRERIAEALYVMLMGHCAAGNMHWSMDLCAEKAREWADSFVASTPERPKTAELDAVRADLREAIELLRAFRRYRRMIADWEPIWYQADALLEKHKEKP